MRPLRRQRGTIYNKSRRLRNFLEHTTHVSVPAPTLELRITDIILKSDNVILNETYTPLDDYRPRYPVNIHTRATLQRRTLIIRLDDMSACFAPFMGLSSF
jgi:hypothetical protein